MLIHEDLSILKTPRIAKVYMLSSYTYTQYTSQHKATISKFSYHSRLGTLSSFPQR